MSSNRVRVDEAAARAAYMKHEERLEQFYRETSAAESSLGRYSAALESSDERTIIAQTAVGFLVSQALCVAQATNMPAAVLAHVFREAGFLVQSVTAEVVAAEKAGLS